jgi:protein-disulfide isomerase
MCLLRRRSLRRIAIPFVLFVWAELAASASPIAARIDGEEIPTATVDALSFKEVQRIRARLMAVAESATQDLIDQRLETKHPSAQTQARKRAELYRAYDVQLTLPEPEALETSLAPDGVVALIGDEPIRAAAVEKMAALRLYRLRGELYLQRRRDLESLIERRLLQLEADSRGVSAEALEKSLSEPQQVTDAEIEAFVARERAAGRIVENPERVRPYLAFQKTYQRRSSVLQARRARTEIRVELAPPTRPRLAMDVDGGVTFGSASGPALVVYTNYACALCRSTHRELDRLLGKSQPPRIVLHDFVHDAASMEAAVIVRCAARSARAAAVRQLVLRSDPPPPGEVWFSAEELQSIARSAGMSASTLRACTAAPEIRARIEQDTQAAHRLGFDDPPAFVAAGIPLSGMQSAEQLGEALSGRSDSALEAPSH